MVAITATLVLLTAIKAGTVFEPDAAKPIPGLLLVQLYTVPATVPVMVNKAEVAPLHTI